MSKKTSIEATTDMEAVMAELADLREQVSKSKKKKSMKETLDEIEVGIDWDKEVQLRTWMSIKPKDDRAFFKWLTEHDPEFAMYQLVPGDDMAEWVDLNGNDINNYRIDAENRIRYNELMLGWMPLKKRIALDKMDLESRYGTEKEVREKVDVINEGMMKDLVDSGRYNMRTKSGSKAHAHIDPPQAIPTDMVTGSMMSS